MTDQSTNRRRVHPRRLRYTQALIKSSRLKSPPPLQPQSTSTILKDDNPHVVKPLESQGQRVNRFRLTRKSLLFVGVTVLLLVAGGVILAFVGSGNGVGSDPIPTKIIGSVDFTVYYPTNLPAGFKLDKHSFSIPQYDVIVFDLANNKSEKIYLSEEPRPSTFNFGGYYKNFTDEQSTIIGSGTIVVGRINNGETEVGSLATNKTWLLTNTTAAVPLSQLSNMLNSLLIDH
jgi:hypothetical protein